MAEGARLESAYTPKGYRGFESRFLRKELDEKSQFANWNFKTLIEKKQTKSNQSLSNYEKTFFDFGSGRGFQPCSC